MREAGQPKGPAGGDPPLVRACTPTHRRTQPHLRGAAMAAAEAGAGAAVLWALHESLLQRGCLHTQQGGCSQNGDLHIGQTLLWLVLNHLYRHAEWNLYLHVRHAIFGRERSTGWMTL